jgi:hypothetical protein
MSEPFTPAPRKTKRRRGAPPGNANALKHGFYSPRFNAGELRDLDTFPANNLQDEILMLRVFIRRVLDRSDQLDSPNDYISMLRALSLATRSITSLLRAHQLLGGDTNEISKLLSQAITEVNEELRSPDAPFFPPLQNYPGI